MKKFVVFVAACFLACSFLLTAQTASAAIGNGSTAWEQLIPGYTFSFSNGVMGDYQFGLFDISNPSGPTDPIDHVLLLQTGISSAVITGGTLGSIEVAYQPGGSVNFSNFSGLGLYLYDTTSPGTIYYDYTYTENEWAPGNFTINFAVGPMISLLNATPVATPVPTSLLLLGSGLVGLFGLRRNQSMS